MINEKRLKIWLDNADVLVRVLFHASGDEAEKIDRDFVNSIFSPGDMHTIHELGTCIHEHSDAKETPVTSTSERTSKSLKIGDLVKFDFDEVSYVVWDDGGKEPIFVRTKTIGDSIFGNNNDLGKSLILRQFIPDWLKDILGDATETGFDIGIFPESVGLYQDNNLVGDFSIFTKKQVEIAKKNGSIKKIESCCHWTKTAYSVSAWDVWRVHTYDSENSVNSCNAGHNEGVSPVLWFKSDVRLSIVSGEGTEETPYKVEIKTKQ